MKFKQVQNSSLQLHRHANAILCNCISLNKKINAFICARSRKECVWQKKKKNERAKTLTTIESHDNQFNKFA